jgi:hypothetical protein
LIGAVEATKPAPKKRADKHRQPPVRRPSATVTPLRRPHSSDHKIRRAPNGVLPVLVQFPDLVASNIVASYCGLATLIKHHGFPVGRWLGSMTRVWTVEEVTDWLASRPTKRPIPQAAKKRDEAAKKREAARTHDEKLADEKLKQSSPEA